jgi:hypothetical protein
MTDQVIKSTHSSPYHEGFSRFNRAVIYLLLDFSSSTENCFNRIFTLLIELANNHILQHLMKVLVDLILQLFICISIFLRQD